MKQWETVSGGSKITADGDSSHEIKRHLLLGRKAMTNLDSILKSRDIICWQRSIKSKLCFSSNHVWMWELDHRESWALKKLCCQRRLFESFLDCKVIKPFNPKGNQSWILIGRTNAKAEAPILWPPDVKSPFIGKDSDAGKIEGVGDFFSGTWKWRTWKKDTWTVSCKDWQVYFCSQVFL